MMLRSCSGDMVESCRGPTTCAISQASNVIDLSRERYLMIWALPTESFMRSTALAQRPHLVAARLSGILAVSWLGSAGAAAPLTIPYQLTHSQNMDPSFNPDGKRWVFISLIAGKEQLFTMNADASDASQITRDDANHEDPAWSPDGTKIAYVQITKTEERIYVMNPDGSEAKAVSPASVRAIHPSWSTDGKRVIYCTDDDLQPPHKNDSDIDVVELATGRVTTLVTGGVNTYPAWSPDTKHLVFRRMLGEMNSEVFVADGDGRNARNLTNHPAFDGWPAWSPDGKLIAFASNRRSRYQIYVMNSDGSNVRLVANTEGRATAPRWSPDGQKLYFTNCAAKDYGTDCEILVSQLPT
jgi:TolB protein